MAPAKAKWIKYCDAIDAILAHNNEFFSSKDVNVNGKLLQAMYHDGFVERRGRQDGLVIYRVSETGRKNLREGLERNL
ncbi:hypothetical protein HNV12_11820 [Methanococcoides sp. SA1]|nr:hypothetical protein [Methanococcoides sp. SA1]